MVYYRVEPKGSARYSDWITHYRAFWPGRINRLHALLEEMDS